MSKHNSSTRLWTVLGGILGLTLIGVSLFWFTRDNRRDAQVAGPTGSDLPAVAAGTGLAHGQLEQAERSSASASSNRLMIDGLAIPVGVRLGGEGALSGVVLERGSNRAVSGARVDLWAIPPTGVELLGRIVDLAALGDGAQERVQPIATEVSGSDGSYAFNGVRMGQYFLEARGARHVADAVESVRVQREGAITNATLYVRPGGRIIGRVLDASGNSVGSAEVFAAPGPGAFIREAVAGDLRVGHARTKPNGSFIVAGLPPGDGYDLSVHSARGALSHVLQITVLPGEDTIVDVTLKQGAVIEGRVVRALVTEDDDDSPLDVQPVEGAHVGAIPRGFRDLHFAREILQRTYAVTDADGLYSLQGVPAGAYDVVAVADGLRPQLGTRVQTIDGVTTRAEDVVLRTGPSVRVHVSNVNGEPIAGVLAQWWVMDWSEFEFDFSLSPFLLQGIEGFAYPVTDIEGWVTVGPFGGEDVQNFVLSKPGTVTQAVRWDPETDESEIEVTLAATAAIEGLVLDANEAKPVTSFTLLSPQRIETTGGAPTPFNPYSGGVLVQDPQGKFRLDPMRPETASLTVSAPGYVSQTIEQIKLTAGETKRGVIVRLTKGGVVRGLVVDDAGEPIAGVQVMATDQKGRPAVAEFSRSPRMKTDSFQAEMNQEFGMGLMDVASQMGILGPGTAVSDADGVFELVGLTAGTFKLVGKHRDYARAEDAEVTLAEGETVEGVSLVMLRGARLVGQITDRFDRAVEGAIVLAASASEFTGGARGRQGPALFLGSNMLFQGQSNVEGDYAIDGLPGGSYFVAVVRGDEQLNLMSFLGTMNFDLVSVAPEGETRFDLIDSSMGGVRVFGRITSNGEPVSRGGLFALNFDSDNLLGVDAKVAEVRADGTYEFTGLAPGDYRISYGGSGGDADFEMEVLDVAEQRMDFEMPSSSVVGLVLSPEGEPLGGVLLQCARTDQSFSGQGILGSIISREGNVDWARTDEDGRFEFGDLSAGAYEVSVTRVARRGSKSRNQYAPREPLSIEVGERETSEELVFKLEPALAITGRVVDEFGVVVAKARVRAWLSDSSASRSKTDRTDEFGAFEVEGLSAVMYDIGVEAKGFGRGATIQVDLSKEPNPVIELTVQRGTQLTLWVTDTSGRAVAGATARVDPVDGRAMPAGQQAERMIEGFISGEGVSDEKGKLEIGRFVEGLWRIEVLRGDERGSTEVTLSGEQMEVDVIVEEAGQ